MTASHAGRPVLRSGRPYRPPEDPADPAAPWGDPRLRTAWLLGTSRVHARERAFAHRRLFVAALEAVGIPCDEFRVSRWESGAVTAPTAALLAYERLLDLPAYHLRGGVDLVRPATSAAHGVPTPLDGSHERFEELLERALDGRADGQEWLELAERIRRTESVFLRAADWQALARRLLVEHAEATGTAYAARAVALSRLVGRPTARRHVIGVIGELAHAEPRARTVQALVHAPGEPATDLAVRLLEHGERRVRAAAAGVLVAWTAEGMASAHAALDQWAARELRGDPDLPWVADVLAHVGGDTRERLLTASRRSGHATLLGRAVVTRELAPREVAGPVAAQLADDAHRRVGARLEDRMLGRLVREALFHVHWRRRLSAVALLAASPYAAGLAQACATLADRAEWSGEVGDALLARQAGWARRWLAAGLAAGVTSS